MNSISDDDRAARIAAEQKSSQWEEKYNKLLIQSTIDDTVRNSGGNPLLVTPLLAPKSRVTTGSDGKPAVVVVSDAGTLTPNQAVMGMKSSEYGYLWSGQQSSGGPQPDSDSGRLTAEQYRAARATEEGRKAIFGKIR
jgi:hypothetical protein